MISASTYSYYGFKARGVIKPLEYQVHVEAHKKLSSLITNNNNEILTVTCVVLRASGEMDEVEIDMTPKANALVKLFGGQPSIVGQVPILDTVLLKKLDPEEEKDVKNAHRLPHPFHEEDHLGDLILVRMNEESEPEHFTKEEWTEFLKEAPFTAEAYEAWKEKHGLNEEEEEGEEGDEMEVEAFIQLFRKNFEKENGRQPTEEEIEEVRADLLTAAEEEEDEDAEDLPEDLTEEEEAVLEKTIARLEKKLKREPTDEEIAEALSKVEGGDVIIAKVNAIEEAENEDDDEEGEDLDEEETAMLMKVNESLAKRLKRDPTAQETIAQLMKSNEGKELGEKLLAMAAFGEDEDDDEDEDEEDDDDDDDEEDPLDEAEQKIVASVVEELSLKLKRAPEDEEVMKALLKKKGGEAIIQKLMGDDEEDDDDEDEEDEEEDEEEEEQKPVVVQSQKRPAAPQAQQQRRPQPQQPQRRAGSVPHRAGQGRRPSHQQKRQRRG